MRLIDADKLKDTILLQDGVNTKTWEQLFKFTVRAIDNAPTIDANCPNCDSGYAQGYSDGYLKGKEDTPHGEWEIVDAEGGKIWNCVCTECGHDPQEYIGGTEDWWLRKPHLPNFCPNCGVRIVNVKGGAE